MPRPDADDLMRHVRSARRAAKIIQAQEEDRLIKVQDPEGRPGRTIYVKESEAKEHGYLEVKDPVEPSISHPPPVQQGPPTPPDLQPHDTSVHGDVQYRDEDHRNLPLQPPPAHDPDPVPRQLPPVHSSSSVHPKVESSGYSYLGLARNVGLGLGTVAATYYGTRYLSQYLSDKFSGWAKPPEPSPRSAYDKDDQAAVEELKNPTPKAPVKMVQDDEGNVVAKPVKPINTLAARMPMYL